MFEWINLARVGAMMVLAFIALVAAPWLTLSWARRPTPPVLFGPSYVASALSPSLWSAVSETAGPPEQLFQVNGQVLNGSFDLTRLMARCRPVTCYVEPGDVLVLVSDGIIERMNAQGEMLGFEAFERAVIGCPAEIGRHLLQAAEAHAGGLLPHDDMTLVIVRAAPVTA